MPLYKSTWLEIYSFDVDIFQFLLLLGICTSFQIYVEMTKVFKESAHEKRGVSVNPKKLWFATLFLSVENG